MKHSMLFPPVAAAILLLGNCRPHTPEQPTTRFILKDNMDTSVHPGDNFYLYVNGTWLKTATIPPTFTDNGAFRDMFENTKQRLKTILEETSSVAQEQGTIEQKVGDFYASGMDSEAVEKRGYQPLIPYLKRIDACNSSAALMAFEGFMQRQNHSYLIGMGVMPDQKNSRMNILAFAQTGLGLPDRDYYFRKDSPTLALQGVYRNYIRKTFQLLGDDSLIAEQKAGLVYALEKDMALSHKDNVALRDPQSNYHKVPVADLNRKMNQIGWESFLVSLGVHSDSVNIAQPAYYARLDTLLAKVPAESWKAYFVFHVTDDAAPFLSSAFVNARFEYANKALYGQQKIKNRWERVYAAVDNNLGEALGQLYVKEYFSDEAKKRALDLVNNLQSAFASRIDKLEWMSDSTKAIAKDKLHAFLKKIGYPDKWRDYSKVVIHRGTYFENLVSCAENEFQFQIAKAGKPVDRTEWMMTPPTINAYYNPLLNEIVFPAGILQLPMFDANADDAINYGAIGMIIGHEMTHGFDDEGAQYDKFGNLENWWSQKDSLRFVGKSKKVINLYNTFTVLDSLHVNGALTNGENIADIGGINIAYDAFKMTPEGKDSILIDGFTPDQRFFISYAQCWRSKEKDELVRQRINTDPHSPPMFRVIGPLMNSPAFFKAFNVQPGNKMYKADSARITIW
jgi:putative endopeptidase